MAAGANTAATGIGERPDYGFAPPASFLKGTAPAAGTPVFDATDAVFAGGAQRSLDPSDMTRDAAARNVKAIQAAINAAHDAGGGIVTLPAGTFAITLSDLGFGSIFLKDNVFLQGAGMGETVLRVSDDTPDDAPITGIIRTTIDHTANYGVADLTVDGNRDNREHVPLPEGTKEIHTNGFYSGGQAILGYPDREARRAEYERENRIKDEDVYVLRVEFRNNSGYGFDPHEQTHRLLVADSKAHGNGLDGFVADYIVGGEYRGNEAWNNDRHGFNIVTVTQDFLLEDNLAHDNGQAGIRIQQGTADIPLPFDIVVRGGAAYDNGNEGVVVREAFDVLVEDVLISGNATYGVRIKGARNVTVKDNTILDNSSSDPGRFAAIRVGPEMVPDATLDRDTNPQIAEDNLIVGNTVGTTGPSISRYGVQVDEHASGTVIEGNAFDAVAREDVRDGGAGTEIREAESGATDPGEEGGGGTDDGPDGETPGSEGSDEEGTGEEVPGDEDPGDGAGPPTDDPDGPAEPTTPDAPGTPDAPKTPDAPTGPADGLPDIFGPLPPAAITIACLIRKAGEAVGRGEDAPSIVDILSVAEGPRSRFLDAVEAFADGSPDAASGTLPGGTSPTLLSGESAGRVRFLDEGGIAAVIFEYGSLIQASFFDEAGGHVWTEKVSVSECHPGALAITPVFDLSAGTSRASVSSEAFEPSVFDPF